jgi:dTDP-4-amino-4,6-dideoxygalactose transaminase
MSRAGPNIIGGMFGLDAEFRPAPAAPPFIEPGSLLIANARSGIRILVEELAPRRVWMPSYLCSAMLDGAGKAPVHFYAVDAHLSISDLNGIAERDLVVVIDYFGFPAQAGLVQYAKSRGAWVLEDACQALLTGGVGAQADFVLFSPRKFVGTPDGGILTSHSDVRLDRLRLEEPPASWALKAFEAVVLRREFDLYGGDRRWFTLFQELERECPVGRFRMSGVSQMLLSHAFNFGAIARARRANYERLARCLASVALFPWLPPEVAPLGFPIRLEARDRVREALFAACIYPPVHWTIADIVPARFRDSHRLSREILTLPCDQRYTPEDMDRMAAVVLEAVRT